MKQLMSSGNPPGVEWAGDPDRDDVPGFILLIPHGDVGSNYILFLSSLETDGQMVCSSRPIQGSPVSCLCLLGQVPKKFIHSYAVSVLGFVQGKTGQYQIASTAQNLVYRLDTVTGQMTAHIVDNHEEPRKQRFIQEFASMPQ